MKRVSLLALALCLCAGARADEGMWMVNAISRVLEMNMQKAGCRLSSREIYNSEDVSLSDAIVSLDFGCTGSMVSAEGLLITNHHCAYDDVFRMSTAEHNYLEDGFWAHTRAQEFPIKGKNAYFLRQVLDVTDEVLALQDSLGLAGKPMGMRRLSHIMETKYGKQTGLEASLSSMWAGSRYYLALYEVYSDLRLVAAPPVCAAAFGGDIDNWEWPQQKCDFAMYRIYTAPDGKPAEYSEDNVPYVPKNVLHVSTEGVRQGSFTMVMGYPGSTFRYSSSAVVSYKSEHKLPIETKLQGGRMKIIAKWMNADPSVRLKYADKYFSLSNVQELREGEYQCYRAYGVAESKKAIERESGLDAMASAMDSVYKALEGPLRNLSVFRETIVRGSGIGAIVMKYKNRDIDLEKEYSKLDLRCEKEIFAYTVEQFYKGIDREMWGPWQTEAYDSFNGNLKALADYMWTDSLMTRESPVFKFFADVKITDFNDRVTQALKDCPASHGATSLTALNNDFTKALYAHRLSQGIDQYPDANSTMRLTYGKVRSLRYPNGRKAPWGTWSDEILAKQSPMYEYTLIPSWKEALEKAGRMPVNFITCCDITGGNSGSPVLNAKGELVGLAFDGNKESLDSDAWYTPELNRCVCVDIRFVLWALRDYAHMDGVLAELGIL